MILSLSSHLNCISLLLFYCIFFLSLSLTVSLCFSFAQIWKGWKIGVGKDWKSLASLPRIVKELDCQVGREDGLYKKLSRCVWMPSPGLKYATRYYLNRFWSTLVEMSGVSPAPQEPEGSFVRPPDEFDEYDPPPPTGEWRERPGTRDRGMLRHGMYHSFHLYNKSFFLPFNFPAIHYFYDSTSYDLRKWERGRERESERKSKRARIEKRKFCLRKFDLYPTSLLSFPPSVITTHKNHPLLLLFHLFLLPIFRYKRFIFTPFVLLFILPLSPLHMM